MITGDEFSYQELKQYVDVLKREVERVRGIGKVTIAGDRQEQVFVEFSLEKVAAFDLDMRSVIGLITTQNSVVASGEIYYEGQKLALRPSGSKNTVAEIENLIIHGRDSGNLIRLKDIATVHRGYIEKPNHVVHYQGKPAISLGISFMSGVNVVEVGERLQQKLAELDTSRPAGIQVDQFYNQASEVAQSVDSFIESLAQAVGIVLVVLFFAMGARSGFIIGIVLLLTMSGTFMLMRWFDVELHRISLGGADYCAWNVSRQCDCCCRRDHCWYQERPNKTSGCQRYRQADTMAFVRSNSDCYHCFCANRFIRRFDWRVYVLAVLGVMFFTVFKLGNCADNYPIFGQSCRQRKRQC